MRVARIFNFLRVIYYSVSRPGSSLQFYEAVFIPETRVAMITTIEISRHHCSGDSRMMIWCGENAIRRRKHDYRATWVIGQSYRVIGNFKWSPRQTVRTWLSSKPDYAMPGISMYNEAKPCYRLVDNYEDGNSGAMKTKVKVRVIVWLLFCLSIHHLSVTVVQYHHLSIWILCGK